MHADPSGASVTAFHALLPNPALLTALDEAGYESPSPIQAATIPHLLAGTDVVGQAQTGTGKTAAFALPLLSRIEVHRRAPQALVLVPTRELAMQVAEAFRRYAAHLEGFEVLAVYGGQPYAPQLQRLERGHDRLVGTLGGATGHLDRGRPERATVRHVERGRARRM
ncbi:MAG: ATP-dependent RNA helicase, partial [Proteobacteria bacterium]